MTALSIMPTLAVIAVVDSLNPSLFLAQFFLLTTSRPTVRIVTYITGILVVNYVSGLLLFSGLQAVLGEFFSSLPTTAVYLAELIIGLGLIGFGVWLIATRRGKARGATLDDARQPRSLHPLATFFFGMAVMVNEMTTALPLLAAVERMSSANLTFIEGAVALLGYNVIFALPLFGFLFVFLRLRERFTQRMDAILRGVQVWSLRMVIVLSLILGVLATVDAVSHFLTGTALLTGVGTG